MLLQTFDLNKSNNPFVHKTLEVSLEKLRKLSQSTSSCLFQNYYRRSQGIYFVVDEYRGQGARDLYTLANQKGAFSEREIGSIADQLLQQMKMIHDKGLILQFMTP